MKTALDREEALRNRDEVVFETAGKERFRIFRTWKVDCHEESIGRLDLHFLNPRMAHQCGAEKAEEEEEEDGESARTRESRGYSRTEIYGAAVRKIR